MKREDIEKAAGDYSGSILGFRDSQSVMDKHKSFSDGAEWRINSVWRNNLKEAQTRKCIMVKFTNGLFNLFEDFRELKGIEDKVESFAYIEDLLPTKEKN